MKKEKQELSAQEAKDVVRSFPKGQGQQQEVVGAIFDQGEALKFLEWLTGPEVQEIRRKLKEQGR